jgi:hypothetical protein
MSASMTRRIRIDPAAREPRPFEGFGTSLAWWASAVGRLPRAEREPVLRRLFSLSDGGLGLNVVRFNAGGGEQPGLPMTMDPRAVMDGYQSAPERPLDETADAGQRAVLRDAARIAAEEGRELVVEVFGNSPPWWATVSGSVTGASDASGLPAPNLDPVFSADYLRCLADVADFIEHDAHVRVASISPFNEPTSDWWRFGGPQEGCHFTPEGIDTLLRESLAEHAAGPLRRHGSSGRGHSRLVAASEEWSLDQTLATWDALGATARRAVGRLNVHTYDGSNRTAVRALAEEAGIPLWVSEFGTGDVSGATLVQTLARDLRELMPTAWVLWQAVSTDAWGLLVSDPQGRPRRTTAAFEVFARFTRALRPRMRLVACDGSGAVAAISEDSVAVVLAAAPDAAAETFELDLSAFTRPATVVAETSVIGALGGPSRAELAPQADGTVRFEVPVGAIVSVQAAGVGARTREAS